MPTRFGSLKFDRNATLGLTFLVVGVLLPTACVLWFMNEAMGVQVTAARQELAESHRRQLQLLRSQIDERWRSAVAAIELGADEPGVAFARLVTAGVADSLIVAAAGGEPAYPRVWPSLMAARDDPAGRTPAWNRAQALEYGQRFADAFAEYSALADAAENASLKARALQAAARCLLRLGDRARAVELLETRFAPSELAAARDPRGRSIAADEQLLLLELLPETDARREAVAGRLAAMLRDYRIEMPSAQRLFLMEALAADRGEEPAALFATYEAERLGLGLLSATAELDFGAGTLDAARVPGLWRVALPDGRGVALYRTASILARADDLLSAEAGSVRFLLVPPGEEGPADAIAAGPMLPGWQLAFTPLDAAAVEAFRRGRSVYYVWIGSVVVVAIALTGFLALGVYRRQIQLAALKTDLVAAVSHELRTPLSSMRLLVDTLLEDRHADERKTRDYLELIARENARLSRLIESFLEFSRLERMQRHFEFAPTRPADVVADAVAAARDRFEQTDCVAVTVEPELPDVHADREALATVLVNLLDNAYKYSAGERRIAVRVRRESARVVFAVADSGIGIHPRDHKRIFQRFFQVDRRLSRETGGVGLGLSIVELIVRAHRGSIRVESRPGEGSTFSVYVPIAAASELAA
jgi:signal transduction histidine kinase